MRRPHQSETSDEDDANEPSFAQLIESVTPIKQDISARYTTPQKKQRSLAVNARRMAAMGEADTRETHLSSHPALIQTVAGDAVLHYKHINLQQRLFEQLQAGKLPWNDSVDLHQCTIEQARSAVLRIIEQNQTTHQVVVKIIHGKGIDAVLKSHVYGWLKQHPDVLACCSAPTKQGGAGSLLVLLRKRPSS